MIAIQGADVVVDGVEVCCQRVQHARQAILNAVDVPQACSLQDEEVVGADVDADQLGSGMRREETVSKSELGAAIRHMDGVVGAESSTAVVRASEVNEVTARLTRAGSVGKALLERPCRWGRVSTEVVRVSRVDQRAKAEGDGVAQGQIGRWRARGGQGTA